MSSPGDDPTLVWDAFVDLAQPFDTSGPGGEAVRGPGWFAALSNEQSAELDVCGLGPNATDASAKALLEAIGRDLPALVFVSSFADPEASAALGPNGLDTVSVREPLMRSSRRPEPGPTPQRIEPARDAATSDVGVALTAEAHHVDRGMVVAGLSLRQSCRPTDR